MADSEWGTQRDTAVPGHSGLPLTQSLTALEESISQVHFDV